MEEEIRNLSQEDDIKKTLQELVQRAAKDDLSGLLNRSTMERFIKRRLEEMTPEERCALFIVDLDDFKLVNDTLGHQAGDAAIRQSAEILSQIFRASDIVGRLGGDEFAVFICGRISEELVREKAATICERLQLALGTSRLVNLTASVGVYLAQGQQTFESLYQSADLALYRAKKAGKHTFCLKNYEKDGFQDGHFAAFRPVNAISLVKLLEYMDDGVALLELGDEHLQIIYVSPSYCRICGEEYEGFKLPRMLEELVHSDDLPGLVAALRAGLARGETVEYDHRAYAKAQGRELWLHIRANVVEYALENPVMLVTISDITRSRQEREALKLANRRLQAAFDQTSMGMWEVDVAQRTLRTFATDGSFVALAGSETRFPDALVDGGWIHPDSVPRFLKFAQEMLDGRTRGYGNFIIRRHLAGGYGWTALSYQVLFDEAGQAVRVVGVAEDFPRSFGDPVFWENAFQVPLPEGMLADLVARMRADLDADVVETLWHGVQNLNAKTVDWSVDELLHGYRASFYDPEDDGEFSALLDRAALLAAWREGRRWFSGEHRCADTNGSIRWMRTVLHLTENPGSGHVMLFGYVLDVEHARRLEQELVTPAVRSDVTGLYALETLEELAMCAFAERRSGNAAVVLLRAFGIADAQLVTPEVTVLHRELSAALQLALAGDALLGYAEAEDAVIVFPYVAGKEELRTRLETTLGFIRRVFAADPRTAGLRLIMGVALEPVQRAVYTTLLGQARRACVCSQDAAEDTIAFAEEGQRSCLVLECSDVIATEAEERLSEQEKDLALRCISAMLSAHSLDDSFRAVLKLLGNYYRADRVYTLMLVENQDAVVMTFEWTANGKHSIKHTVSGMRLERFPALERCRAEKAPVALAREHAASLSGERAASVWRYTAFPLIREGEVVGFLCIENAMQHPGDLGLFTTLVPYLLQERERFRPKERTLRSIDQLMGLPDLRAYTEAIGGLTSAQYSTLGVVCLSVPNLAAINGDMGFEFGSRLLWFVAKTLSELFDGSLLFRTWEAEFVCFLPDVTQEVFQLRVSRLRAILTRRYPRQMRIGTAWAEGEFAAERLVKTAKAALGAQEEISQEMQRFVKAAEDGLGEGETLSEERFTVYYQPKIDLTTGELVGAEALVRGIGEDGSLIAPAQFITYMEEDGSIRALDLFVLEQALAQMAAWQEKGLGLVPVSVNLSRVTMVSPTTPASILALQSHYPTIPPEALEIEITERGPMETETFQDAVEKYSACGLRLSLDDFGSQYANLSLFTNVRFDTVKLDRSLIARLGDNPVNEALVRDIIAICRTYGMTCVAEGVETEEHAALLRSLGCRFAQGYYYDKPLAAADFEEKYLWRRTLKFSDHTGKETHS